MLCDAYWKTPLGKKPRYATSGAGKRACLPFRGVRAPTTMPASPSSTRRSATTSRRRRQRSSAPLPPSRRRRRLASSSSTLGDPLWRRRCVLRRSPPLAAAPSSAAHPPRWQNVAYLFRECKHNKIITKVQDCICLDIQIIHSFNDNIFF